MIAAVHFRNFKALRSAAVRLEPFNLLIGPNGSGKTSLIQALVQLRTLSGLPVVHAHDRAGRHPTGSQLDFHFKPPYQNVRVTLRCSSDELVCDQLVVDHPAGIVGEGQWGELRTWLQTIRHFRFEPQAMAAPARPTAAAELAADAGNLAAVLAAWREKAPAALARLTGEFCRIMPEFAGLDFREATEGRIELRARLAEGHETLPADSLSQGTLNLLALLTLAQAPEAPGVVCLEEADRGVHPRMLREVRDALYRLCYPAEGGEARAPAQVIATTHSPYLLDLFREHPEEVVLAHKRGNAATFERLAERKDLLELMREAHLGDLWYSGILGSVPGE